MGKQEEKLWWFLDHQIPAGGQWVTTTDMTLTVGAMTSYYKFFTFLQVWWWEGGCLKMKVYHRSMLDMEWDLSHGSQQINIVNGWSVGSQWGRLLQLPHEDLSHVWSSTHVPLDLPLLSDQSFPAPSSLLYGHDIQLLHHLAAVLRTCSNFSMSFLLCKAQFLSLYSKQDWPVLSQSRPCCDLDKRHPTSLNVAKIVFTLCIMYQPHNTVGPGWARGQFTE